MRAAQLPTLRAICEFLYVPTNLYLCINSFNTWNCSNICSSAWTVLQYCKSGREDKVRDYFLKGRCNLFPYKGLKIQLKILKICQKSSFENWKEHPVVFSVFTFFVTMIASSKTNITFFKNKDIIFTIIYLSQVRRETEFSPWTGKPNNKVSKTVPDNRQSFINKDVLSMKIITAAKQNMVQDPELLSEVWQQTHLKETE